MNPTIIKSLPLAWDFSADILRYIMDQPVDVSLKSGERAIVKRRDIWNIARDSMFGSREEKAKAKAQDWLDESQVTAYDILASDGLVLCSDGFIFVCTGAEYVRELISPIYTTPSGWLRTLLLRINGAERATRKFSYKAQFEWNDYQPREYSRKAIGVSMTLNKFEYCISGRGR